MWKTFKKYEKEFLTKFTTAIARSVEADDQDQNALNLKALIKMLKAAQMSNLKVRENRRHFYDISVSGINLLKGEIQNLMDQGTSETVL